MINLSYEQKSNILFWASLAVAVIAIVTAFVTLGFQAYVRWKLNQTFTFFGGSALEVLLVVGVGLLLALLYIYRERR